LNSTTFSELGLLPAIQQALAEEQYATATPIQALAIPHVLQGRDLIGCAQTGTGKTAAFALPLLQHIGEQNRPSQPGEPRVLVLSPTRELAAQIAESFLTYGRHLRYRLATVFGGVGQSNQVRALRRGVHVLVATPGRLLDLMNQGHVRLDRLEVFVLDEADRMLDMGFLPDLKRIMQHLPQERQSLFFSATLPERVSQLAKQLLRDPVRVEITPPATTVEQIEQKVFFVARGNKRALLGHVLAEPDVGQTLVFTRTKRGADVVADQLGKHGFRAHAIHGNKSQPQRDRILRGFRDGRFQVLVATDLAARGIDVDGITHVINFDLPHEPECYVHRIGRTGRAGATGTALTFCDGSERGQLRAIESLIRRTIPVHTEHAFHEARSNTVHSGDPQRGPRRRRRPGPSRHRQSQGAGRS
jgi:ATP-dependent RNA helicase RhlE